MSLRNQHLYSCEYMLVFKYFQAVGLKEIVIYKMYISKTIFRNLNRANP